MSIYMILQRFHGLITSSIQGQSKVRDMTPINFQDRIGNLYIKGIQTSLIQIELKRTTNKQMFRQFHICQSCFIKFQLYYQNAVNLPMCVFKLSDTLFMISTDFFQFQLYQQTPLYNGIALHSSNPLAFILPSKDQKSKAVMFQHYQCYLRLSSQRGSVDFQM